MKESCHKQHVRYHMILVKTGVIIMLMLLLITPSTGQTVKKTQGIINAATIPYNASGLAAGEAQAAVSEGLSSVYWNPATLNATKKEILISYRPFKENMSISFFGMGVSLRKYGGIFIATSKYANSEDAYSSDNPAMLQYQFGYVNQPLRWFVLGAVLKYVEADLVDTKRSRLVCDLGILVKTPLFSRRDNPSEGLNLGFSISNLGDNNMKSAVTDLRYEIPQTIRLGLSAAPLKIHGNTIRFSADAVHPQQEPEHMNLGIKIMTNRQKRNSLYVSIGAKMPFKEDNYGGFSCGIGSRIKLINNLKLSVQYAFTDWKSVDGNHCFGLGLIL
ncbi:hypothetical protein JW835_06370 [bacterium]|nr:hypothetical protein [bacterium]